MHVTWCSSLLSPPLFKGVDAIASACLSVRPSVCMLCSILLSHRTKSNQVWCARFLYKWGVRQHFFAIPLGPQGGFKGQLSYLKSQFQRFLYQTLCLFSKIKEMGFSFCRLGHTPGGGTWGCLGVKSFLFFLPNMVLWHIKLKGMVSRTGYKLNVHPMVKLVTLRYSQWVNYH